MPERATIVRYAALLVAKIPSGPITEAIAKGATS